jgi:voltage-gated potassium channel
MIEKTLGQLRRALLALLFVVFAGTVGFYLLGNDWTLLDSFYMTVISITTTGFKEVRPLSDVGKIFTIIIIILGVGTIAYTGGRGVQLLIETQIFGRRRMNKKVQELRNHYIVCGFGRMGKYICEELRRSKVPFVVVEQEEAKIDILKEMGYLYVQGNATVDETLLRAGIDSARGLVAVLTNDAENVFASLSAKVLNPKVFVVARAVQEETESKLKKAGADRVVKPYEIGGTRMANLLLRPGVVEFIDVVALGKSFDLTLEEVMVSPNSMLIGKTLAESPLRKDLNIMIVAIFRKDGQFTYNPKSSAIIQTGDRLIAIGEAVNLPKLNQLCLGEIKTVGQSA